MNAATPSLTIPPPLMDPSTKMDSASVREPASLMKSASLKDPSSVMKAPPSVVPLDVNHTAHSRDTCSTSVSPPVAPKSSSSGSFHLLTLGSSSSPNLRTSPLSSPTQPLGSSAPPTFDLPPMQRGPPSTTQGGDRLGSTTPSSTIPTPSSLGMGMGQSVGTSVEKAHNVPIAKRVTVKPPDIQSVSLPGVCVCACVCACLPACTYIHIYVRMCLHAYVQYVCVHTLLCTVCIGCMYVL